jgi:sugar phosphate isomerase/epimerase
MEKTAIALQLYSIREDVEKDFYGSLKKVKAMGYAGVEFAGYANLSAPQLKQYLDELDLQVAGSHILYDHLKNNLQQTLDYEETIGNKNIVIPYNQFATLAEWDAFIKELAPLAKAVHARGMQLFYHNHGHEFTSFPAVDLVDRVLQVPGMKAEPDLYWLAYAHVDILPWLARHAAQVGLFHIKDMQQNPTESTEVGAGILPIKDYVSQAKSLAVPWLIVEQEAFQTLSPMEAAAMSCQNLQQIVKEVFR